MQIIFGNNVILIQVYKFYQENMKKENKLVNLNL